MNPIKEQVEGSIHLMPMLLGDRAAVYALNKELGLLKLRKDKIEFLNTLLDLAGRKLAEPALVCDDPKVCDDVITTNGVIFFTSRQLEHMSLELVCY